MCFGPFKPSPVIDLAAHFGSTTSCSWYRIKGVFDAICRSLKRGAVAGVEFYGEVETRTLSFIRRARELGFTLDKIRALLALSAEQGKEVCADVRHLAANHLGDVRSKIADLRAMERVLADAVRRCGEGGSARCPLIDALSRS